MIEIGQSVEVLQRDMFDDLSGKKGVVVKVVPTKKVEPEYEYAYRVRLTDGTEREYAYPELRKCA